MTQVLERRWRGGTVLLLLALALAGFVIATKIVRGNSAGTPASVASDPLTTLDQIALLDVDLGTVTISRNQIVAVVNLDHVAIFGVKFLDHHHSASSRINGAPIRRWKIQSGMQSRTTRNRVNTPAKN